MNCNEPWTSPNEAVPSLFLEWNTLKIELQEGFTKRDLSRTENPMKQGIELFLKLYIGPIFNRLSTLQKV